MLWGPPREIAQTIDLNAAGVMFSFDLIFLPHSTVALSIGCSCLILEEFEKAMMDQMHWNDYFCKFKFTLLVYQTGPSYMMDDPMP